MSYNRYCPTSKASSRSTLSYCRNSRPEWWNGEEMSLRVNYACVWGNLWEVSLNEWVPQWVSQLNEWVRKWMRNWGSEWVSECVQWVQWVSLRSLSLKQWLGGSWVYERHIIWNFEGFSRVLIYRIVHTTTHLSIHCRHRRIKLQNYTARYWVVSNQDQKPNLNKLVDHIHMLVTDWYSIRYKNTAYHCRKETGKQELRGDTLPFQRCPVDQQRTETLEVVW